jgi:uncharacterized protein
LKTNKLYFNRRLDSELSLWQADSERKPLLLRGARQVGKSTAVRKLAEEFDYFIELNFDEKPSLKTLFEKDLSPKVICENLEAIYQTPIIEGRTLVFFDEVQSCIPALSSLRYFYEQMPSLHLIAAGSLLEFALAELPTFGVGRIRSMFVYPFSFEEYLLAMDANQLLHLLKTASPSNPLIDVLSTKTQIIAIFNLSFCTVIAHFL